MSSSYPVRVLDTHWHAADYLGSFSDRKLFNDDRNNGSVIRYGAMCVCLRCLKNHHRLYYLKRNGSNWFASTLKKPLWLMNVFLRKTEKSAETPVTWSMSKQPVPCKLFCVCESSCLGHSKTMVGTQGGGREFRISCPPTRCVFLWVSDRKNIGWGFWL